MMFEKISSEVDNFYETISLNKEQIQTRKAMCDRINKILENYYPDCKLEIFGSTANGFGTKNSDIDLLFKPFPQYVTVDFESVADKDGFKVPSLTDIKSNKVPKEVLLQMGMTSQLSFVKKVLKKEGSFYPIILIKATCPILHFPLRRLGTTCDISCKSSQVLYNTKLLQFYGEIDKRVCPLVVTLRYWAKCLSIINSGRLASYGFILLIIFFLQNTNPAILPTVKSLRRQTVKQHIVDDWDVSFSADKNAVNVFYNTKSLGELLKEFISFYLNFEFDNYIVNIHSGKKISIEELKSNTVDERLNEFKESPMCIQDPFILSCNVGRNTTYKVRSLFKQSLLIADKILDTLENPESKDNIDILFDTKRYSFIDYADISSSRRAVSFFFDFDTIKACNKNLKDPSYLDVCSSILDLVQYGLLIECEVIDGTIFIQTKDKKQVSKDCNELLMSLQCTVFNRTHVGRRKIHDTPSVNCDASQFDCNTVRNQYIISNYLLQKNPLLSSSEPYCWFYCDCYAYENKQLKGVIVVLSPLTESKENSSIFNSLKGYICKVLPEMLSENINNLNANGI